MPTEMQCRIYGGAYPCRLKVEGLERLVAFGVMQALGVVLRQTWPRVPAHAQTLWNRLAEEHTAAGSFTVMPQQPVEEDGNDVASESQSGGKAVEDAEKDAGVPNMQHMGTTETREELQKAIAEVAEVVWWAGGEAFREHVQQASCEVSNRLLRQVTCMQTVRSTGLQAGPRGC